MNSANDFFDAYTGVLESSSKGDWLLHVKRIVIKWSHNCIVPLFTSLKWVYWDSLAAVPVKVMQQVKLVLLLLHSPDSSQS